LGKKDLTKYSPVKVVTVIGAGVMGRAIAVACAKEGIETILHDIDPAALRSAQNNINGTIDRLSLLGNIDEPQVVKKQVKTERDLKASIASAQLVIESVPENLELKMRVFEKLDAISSRDILLASNTSGLSISKLASRCTFPDRILGIHFFAPAYILKAVEIIPGRKTTSQSVRAAEKFAKEIGKIPIVLLKDSTNFVINSIQFAMMKEAKRLLDSGTISSMAEVDRAIIHSFPVRQLLFGLFRDSDMISPYSSLTHEGRRNFTTNYDYSETSEKAIALRDSALIELEASVERIRKSKLSRWET
jgi:3-hydroxybutyryl-CoA dehydrogenase